MRRTALPLVLVTALALGACQEEVAEETTAATDSVDMEMQMPAPEATAVVSGLIDPETASEADLMALGLDSATVAAIMAARPIEDMMEVDALLVEAGMTEAQRDELYARMFKPLDLNTASGQEIQLIPGVGDRMQHEFEEYRPYSDIATFQREMAKYVDDEEVQRLTRYVRIGGGDAM